MVANEYRGGINYFPVDWPDLGEVLLLAGPARFAARIVVIMTYATSDKIEL